jgi:hypothetical protein
MSAASTTLRIAAAAALTVGLLAGCAGTEDAGRDVAPGGDGSDATTPVPTGAVDARLASLDDLTAEIAAALADASERSGIPAEAIAVASALVVTWSDGSLGCPQPGMMYTQALVPGYLLTLEVGGERVAYHGAAGSDPSPCGWPAP